MRYLVLLLLITVATNSFSQSKIEGKWVLNLQETLAKMDAGRKQSLNSIAPERKEKIESSLAKKTFNFSSEATFIVEWSNGKSMKTDTGTWRRQEDKVIVNINNQEYIYKASFANGMLILEKQSTSSGLFHFLAFNR